MADDTPEPVAPAHDASEQISEKAPEKVAEKAPPKPTSASTQTTVTARQIDRTILRLNKLLSNPGGLSASLQISNYVLYILTYLQPKIPALLSLLKSLPSLVRSSGPTKPPTRTLVSQTIPVALPPVAALATLLSKCRTTLRLLGCFPIYAWLRTLATGPKPGADLVLHRIAVLQASSYFIYQALENICFLADNGVVPKSVISKLNRGNSTTARLYTTAYRFWLSGIVCDLLRLGRESQLTSRRRALQQQMQQEGRELAYYQEEEDQKVDYKWWTDLATASAWAPMAYHYSVDNGGIPGWNIGWMGLCGLIAGTERLSGLWRSTGE